MITQDQFLNLAQRLGEQTLAKRLRIQVDFAASMFGSGRGVLHFENLGAIATAARIGLRLTGLTTRCEKESLNFQVENIDAELERLPASFNGLRILHLTDIHIDGFIDGGKKLQETLRTLEFDLCVLTGDYRFLTYGPYEACGNKMLTLLDVLQCKLGIYAVMGNHDYIEEVPYFDAAGAHVLLNDSIELKRNGEELHLAGIDDPHFYGTDDIDKAFSAIPHDACTIFLAHSPEVYREAEKKNVSYYLCGHTHGGQICLPGKIPIITHGACPRYMCSGAWKYKKMKGYTGRGVGCSAVQARLNCPPEITIHTLKKL